MDGFELIQGSILEEKKRLKWIQKIEMSWQYAISWCRQANKMQFLMYKYYTRRYSLLLTKTNQVDDNIKLCQKETNQSITTNSTVVWLVYVD